MPAKVTSQHEVIFSVQFFCSHNNNSAAIAGVENKFKQWPDNDQDHQNNSHDN
jgi:hypothetical protein